jgi:two-component system, LytTR family, sensor kinase
MERCFARHVVLMESPPATQARPRQPSLRPTSAHRAGPQADPRPGTSARIGALYLSGGLGIWFWVHLVRIEAGIRPLNPEHRLLASTSPRLLAIPGALLVTAAAWGAYLIARRAPSRLRASGQHAARVLAYVLAAAVGCTLVEGVLRHGATIPWANRGRVGPWDEFGAVAVPLLLAGLLAHVLEYARRHRERQLFVLHLEAELARAQAQRASAELRVLKHQMSPHFVFSALDGVVARIHSDPARAESMVVHLADILRQAMSASAESEVALEEEISVLEPYLEIERLRMDGRLALEWDVDEAALDAYVPQLILRSMVEAAVMATPEGHLHLRIRAYECDGHLLLEMDERCIPATARTPGASLHTVVLNSAPRLWQLYGKNFRLEAAAGAGVRLQIPWHESPAPPPQAEVHGATTGRCPTMASRARGAPACALLAIALVILWSPRYAALAGTVTDSGHVVTAAGAYTCLLLTAAACGHMAFRAYGVSTRDGRVGTSGWSPILRAHTGPAALSAFVLLATDQICRILLRGWHPADPATATVIFLYSTFIYSVVYFAVAVIADAVEYARWGREPRLGLVRWERELARADLMRASAELSALRLQLNPHFVFNALQAVTTLVRRAPETAERILLRLSELLRDTMADSAREQVTLAEEIHTLVAFLEIEQLRLGGGLRVEWEIKDEARRGLVPYLVLQPFVENAVRHGIVPAGGAGQVRISARRWNGALELEVADDGVGLPTDPPAGVRTGHTGIGIPNTRSRLAQLYGDRFSLELISGGTRTGTTVRLLLPWNEAPSGEADG